MNSAMKTAASHFWQLNRFALVGVLATIVHLSVSRLVFFYQANFPEFGVNAIAFSIAFFVSFWGHKHFTFQVNGSMMKFLGVSLLGFVVNNILLFYIINAGFLTGWNAILLSTLSVPILTYFLSKLWVFR
ncbi:GtrA family protein [Shewanella surugensis]|uniref:GtrA family protein n=1 Tax=Shewanella surugensis TaxID=212020 RepID=A0ABT0LIC2_9GAMM|nr:GtrA family protein [Shewanella surugensis]MCL1127453.1 GtrA family protein [Shewanella surugensis]